VGIEVDAGDFFCVGGDGGGGLEDGIGGEVGGGHWVVRCEVGLRLQYQYEEVR